MIFSELEHTAHTEKDYDDGGKPTEAPAACSEQYSGQQPGVSEGHPLLGSQTAAQGPSQRGGLDSSKPAPQTSSTCEERNCCHDNSCSASSFKPQVSSSPGSAAGCQASHESTSSDDSDLPHITLHAAGMHQSHAQHGLSQNSQTLRVQPPDKPTIRGEPVPHKPLASEPLLEDNDDRFCLFPIK